MFRINRGRKAIVPIALACMCVVSLGVLAQEASSSALVDQIMVKVPHSVLLPGEQVRAQVQIYPRMAKDTEIAWSSSAPEFARVDQSGRILAQRSSRTPDEGVDVDIWARATDGSLAMSCVTVRVMPPVRRLSLAQEWMQLDAGADGVAGVVANIEPGALAGLTPVSWHSSDDSIALVEAAGKGEVALIYPLSPGEVTITVRAEDGSGKEAAMRVKVQ